MTEEGNRIMEDRIRILCLYRGSSDPLNCRRGILAPTMRKTRITKNEGKRWENGEQITDY